MIKKILKIKNIGKYDIGSASDDLSFEKRTVVFGANKVGKTTFVSILKSLREARRSYVKSRKTFGSYPRDVQECEILCDDGTKYTYDSKWSFDNLEIFDNDFIHRNVFIGDKIEQDQKTQLHKILVDEENLTLQKEIDVEEKNYADLLKDKENARKDIGQFADEFVKLRERDEIKDLVVRLKDNKDRQNQYKNQVKLNQLKTLTKLSFDFYSFEKNIKQDIDSNLEGKIKKHIRSCWKHNSEDVDFLNIGLNKISLKKNLCPFCGQSLESVSALISYMKNYFGEAYKKTQSTIKDSIDTFKKIDLQKEIAQFKAEGFEFLTKFDEQRLSSHLKVILEKLEQKQKDLSIDIKLEELSEYKEYKKVITSMYLETKSLKIESIDIDNLQKEYTSLKINQERFSDAGKEKYEKYKLLEKDVSKKKKDIDTLNNNLKKKLNVLFSKYLEDINLVLAASFANFRVKELKSISNRSLKESFFCDYAFVFDGTHEIDIVSKEDKPQFKNTLSDSDKRIFAFALFIAKLKRDSSLVHKIVVLDDPFTSLDEERRDAMINTLNNLKCEQVIVLSHSRSFVKRCISKFYENRDESAGKTKALRLKNLPSKKTKIVKLNVNEDNDFLEGVEKYLKILSEADEATIMSDYDNIRKIIEYIVKAKYGHLLSPEESRLPMRYFLNTSCKSPMKGDIQENDYQENHHDSVNQPSPEELLQKRNNFISIVLPKI